MSWGGYIPGHLLREPGMIESLAEFMENERKQMSNEVQKVYRVVAKNGEPVDNRINGRKNLYFEAGHAKSAATQFNKIYRMYNGEPTQLDDAPYTVQEGTITWQ